MTCIFLWFCVMIYPYRRRQNLKALIRVKSYVNEGYMKDEDGKTTKPDNLISSSSENEGKVDENRNNNDIFKKNDKADINIASSEERKLYDPLKEGSGNLVNPFDVSPEKSMNKLDFINCNLSHKKKPEPTAKENSENFSDEQDIGLQSANPIKSNEKDQMSGAFNESKYQQTKNSHTKEKDATLRLKISDDMLNPASLHNIKKLRREAVFEAPIMSTHL